MSFVIYGEINFPSNKELREIAAVICNLEFIRVPRKDGVDTNSNKWNILLNVLGKDFDLLSPFDHQNYIDPDRPVSFQVVDFITDLRAQVLSKYLEKLPSATGEFIQLNMILASLYAVNTLCNERQHRYFMTKTRRVIH